MKMVRWWKALALATAILALAALSIVFTSCSSTGTAQLRVINAIPDGKSSLSVIINGSTPVTGLAFGSVDPANTKPPATYFGVTSGTITLEAFYTGQNTNPVINYTTAVLNGGVQYTMLLAGFATPHSTAFPPVAYLIADDNNPPAVGTVKIRMINASAYSVGQYPSGFDIYFLPPGQAISGIPQLTGLTLGQTGFGYIALNYLPEYVVWITPHGSTLPLLNPAPTVAESTSQVTTLVILDQPGGGGISQSVLSLVDQQ